MRHVDFEIPAAIVGPRHVLAEPAGRDARLEGLSRAACQSFASRRPGQIGPASAVVDARGKRGARDLRRRRGYNRGRGRRRRRNEVARNRGLAATEINEIAQPAAGIDLVVVALAEDQVVAAATEELVTP